MEKKKAPLGIRIIYWLVQIAFILFAVSCGAIVVFNVLLYFGLFEKGMQLHVMLPVEVDFLEIGNLPLRDTSIKVELVEAQTSIHFIDTPLFLTKCFGLVLLFIMSLGFYIMWTFRKFIKNVKDGVIFELKNIALLKRFSYGLAALWLCMVVYNEIVYHYIAKLLEFENVSISSDRNSLNALLFIALFTWMLSHIFMVGVKLQKEQNLTI